MTIISIIGGHDREALQAFMNSLIISGGITEVRILDMGESGYFSNLVMELSLVHDVENIHVVDLTQLMAKDDLPPEVLVFMNHSYKLLGDFCSVGFPLVQMITEIILRLQIKILNIVFGDNYRGLLQKSYLDKILRISGADIDGINSVVISSIFQMSKTLNSTESNGVLRCYPKVDGGVYLFDPDNNLSAEDAENLSRELKTKLTMVEKVFTNRSASAYPHIEGSALARFITVYLQKKSWVVACRDDGLHARSPTEREVAYYGLNSDVAVFLPPAGDEDAEAERSPDGSIIEEKAHLRDLGVGTRLSESHKTLNECAFHNVNLCKQAAYIKTMSQEGLQVRRKCKRVTAGKQQSFESHFLFNFVLDVLDNNVVRQKQEISLRKHGSFVINPKSLIAEI